VVQLPTNHPARVAERVATLDLLSGGRVELGLDEAQGPIELHPFGRRVRDKRDVWEEAVKALVPMFTRHSWEWQNEDIVRLTPEELKRKMAEKEASRARS
jgi:alkanesulfonate monooxygenase SsuD/methylene tetrahydromethanopterin reductase-like flavin-dependent oxidoreductase (luciferase family)